MEVLKDILLLVGILFFSLGLPLLIWYFPIRWIVRGRRAARAVLTLGETLTEEQAEEFDRVLLPQARNIFQQLELLEAYVREIREQDKAAWAAGSDDGVGSPIPDSYHRMEDPTEVSTEESESLDPFVSPSNPGGAEEDSIVRQLERLASLRQQDLITEAEYVQLKSKLIGGQEPNWP